jgi:hypothetical protein
MASTQDSIVSIPENSFIMGSKQSVVTEINGHIINGCRNNYLNVTLGRKKL